MKKIIVTTPEELDELIQSSVRKALGEQKPSSSKEDDRYLTLTEAAAYIKRAPQTLYGYTSKRMIPFFKQEHTKPLFFLKSDLDKWLSAGKKKSVSEIKADMKGGDP